MGRPRNTGEQGRKNGSGHIQICISGVRYPAHHIAWAMHYGDWPNKIIDHADGNPANNSISNLRMASISENCCNAKVYKNNSSGFKGVHVENGKYVARIWKDKKAVYLGAFSTIEEAIAARKLAQETLHKEFSCFRK